MMKYINEKGSNNKLNILNLAYQILLKNLSIITQEIVFYAVLHIIPFSKSAQNVFRFL